MHGQLAGKAKRTQHGCQRNWLKSHPLCDWRSSPLPITCSCTSVCDWKHTECSNKHLLSGWTGGKKPPGSQCLFCKMGLHMHCQRFRRDGEDPTWGSPLPSGLSWVRYCLAQEAFLNPSLCQMHGSWSPMAWGEWTMHKPGCWRVVIGMFPSLDNRGNVKCSLFFLTDSSCLPYFIEKWDLPSEISSKWTKFRKFHCKTTRVREAGWTHGLCL